MFRSPVDSESWVGSEMMMMQTISVTSLMYSKHPFTSLLTPSSLREFTVLDVIPIASGDAPSSSKKPSETSSSESSKRPKYSLSEVEVIRSDDFGVNDNSCVVKSHFGHLLQPGDLVLGYDMRASAWNSDELDRYDVTQGVICKG